jgi:hypothetical protein
MSINRTLSSLFAFGAGLLLSLSAASAQQTPQNYDDSYANGNAPYSNAYPQNAPSILPFGPVGFVHKWDPFAPADISDYGTGPKAKRGFYFDYERLYWSIGKPPAATIGSDAAAGFFVESFNPVTGAPISAFEQSSLTTGIFTAKGSWGNRWETGFMDTNNHGWLVSVIDHVAQTQNFEYNTAPSTILFNDPNNLFNGFAINQNTNVIVPVTFIPRFTDTVLYNRVVLNGVELMKTYRAPRLHNGDYVELMYGARWFQIDDTFEVDGLGGIAADTRIRTRVQNNIVGPQLGLRWFHQRGRWIVAAEGRFTAGMNFENYRQVADFASLANTQANLGGGPLTSGASPVNLNGNVSNAAKFLTEFAPLAEMRLQATYQCTRAFGLTIGYTLLYTNGIGRASDHVNYTAPTFGLANGGNRDSLFINGLSFGVQVNR